MVPTEREEREFSFPLPVCSVEVLGGLDGAHYTGEGDLLYSVCIPMLSVWQHAHRHTQKQCLAVYLGILWPSHLKHEISYHTCNLNMESKDFVKK